MIIFQKFQIFLNIIFQFGSNLKSVLGKITQTKSQGFIVGRPLVNTVFQKHPLRIYRFNETAHNEHQ